MLKEFLVRGQESLHVKLLDTILLENNALLSDNSRDELCGRNIERRVPNTNPPRSNSNRLRHILSIMSLENNIIRSLGDRLELNNRTPQRRDLNRRTDLNMDLLP